jgi:RHS repeat-associated protein
MANKCGYVYIYCSNETPVNVYFDNLQVVHTRGPILETNEFYPFGLKMSGISYSSAGKLQNKDKTFQGQKFDDDLGLNYYSFKWRNHDPQIGRFIEIDPLSDKYVYNSTYAFSENKVTTDVELEGLESTPTNGTRNAANGRYNTQGDLNGDMVVDKTERESWGGAMVSWLGTGSRVALAGVAPGVGYPLIAAEFSGVPSPTAPSSVVGTVVAETGTVVTLEQRAKDIQSTLSPATQSRTTTAVASATTAEGKATTLVASSEKNLRPAQIAALKPGETAVSGAGHAEKTILNHAQANGITVNAVAASRPICAGCATSINNAGAVAASPLKIYPIKQAADATYVKPSIVPLLKQ